MAKALYGLIIRSSRPEPSESGSKTPIRYKNTLECVEGSSPINALRFYCHIFSRVVHIELRGAHPALYTTCHQQTGSYQHSQNDYTFQYSAGSQCVPVSVPPLHHDGSFTTLLRRHHRPPSPSQGVPGKVRHRDAGAKARRRKKGPLFDRRGSC